MKETQKLRNIGVYQGKNVLKELQAKLSERRNRSLLVEGFVNNANEVGSYSLCDGKDMRVFL